MTLRPEVSHQSSSSSSVPKKAIEENITFGTKRHANSVRKNIHAFQNARPSFVGELDLLVRTAHLRQRTCLTRRGSSKGAGGLSWYMMHYRGEVVSKQNVDV